MLQITDLDEGKAEWNLNGTHIIIPIVENQAITEKGTDIPKNTITLNALESTDQAMVNNTIGHTLVIGLDRSIFEQHDEKATGDVILIQNSDLKWRTSREANYCKPSSTYTLSFVDDAKNEVLWTNPSLRTTRKAKPEYYSLEHDKAQLEVVLPNVKTPILEWRSPEKANQLILETNLVNECEKFMPKEVMKGVEIKTVQLNEFTLENVEMSSDLDSGKSLDKSCFEFYPVTVANLDDGATLNVNDSKPESKTDNIEDQIPKTIISNKLTCYEPKVILVEPEHSNVNSDYGSMWLRPHTSEMLIDGMNKSVVEAKIGVGLEGEKQRGMTSILKTSYTTGPQYVSQPKMKGNVSGGSAIMLSENSLPLKKKAKMKTSNSAGCNDDQPTTLQQTDSLHTKTMFSSRESSDSDEPLAGQVTKSGKRGGKCETDSRKRKQFEMEPLMDSEECEEDRRLMERARKSVSSWEVPERSSFKSIFDVVEDLRKRKFFKTSVANLLTEGLLEMNVDLLKEMNNSTADMQYSTHLMAFALMVYFKQPLAFEHLATIFQKGWPSLSAIKEWKNEFNSKIREAAKGTG